MVLVHLCRTKCTHVSRCFGHFQTRHLAYICDPGGTQRKKYGGEFGKPAGKCDIGLRGRVHHAFSKSRIDRMRQSLAVHHLHQGFNSVEVRIHQGDGVRNRARCTRSIYEGEDDRGVAERSPERRSSPADSPPLPNTSISFCLCTPRCVIPVRSCEQRHPVVLTFIQGHQHNERRDQK